ncbi:MAG: hypothetical protein WC124_06610 [Desulfoplanes sp.]
MLHSEFFVGHEMPDHFHLIEKFKMSGTKHGRRHHILSDLQTTLPLAATRIDPLTSWPDHPATQHIQIIGDVLPFNF